MDRRSTGNAQIQKIGETATDNSTPETCGTRDISSILKKQRVEETIPLLTKRWPGVDQVQLRHGSSHSTSCETFRRPSIAQGGRAQGCERSGHPQLRASQVSHRGCSRPQTQVGRTCQSTHWDLRATSASTAARRSSSRSSARALRAVKFPKGCYESAMECASVMVIMEIFLCTEREKLY